MGSCEIRMVVGLGNPGEEYADTRHNVGFRVVDLLSEALKRDPTADVTALGTLTDVRKRKFGARFGEGEFAGKKLILLKPMRFMNCSGQAVATAAGFYKLSPSNLFVISDDMALEVGAIRIRRKGSAGGHKGLADIMEKLGTDEFNRLRVGIGQSGEAEPEDYVLEKATAEEKLLLDKGIEKACEAVICWVKFGIEEAMNKFNEKAKREKKSV